MRFVDMNGLESYYKAHNLPLYERSGYDKYLRENGFNYTVPSIHITGTNGKGSSAAFIKNIYVSAGYKVGLFTSPALSQVNEMMIINDDMIPDEVLMAYMNRYIEGFEKYALTTFEMQTVIVLTYFTEMKVDIAIIEVGMGGEVDATNIFIPKLSILTNVALEHTRFLGNTIEKITLSKAGIVKPNVPVLLGRLNDVAYNTLKGVADKRNSPIIQSLEPTNVSVHAGLTFDFDGYKKLAVSMPASYQADNASLAISAVEALKKLYPVTEADIRQGLKDTFMPGRMEIVSHDPLIILDGGHNPHAASALAVAMKAFSPTPVYIIFAAFKDKNVEAMFRSLESVSKCIVVTSFDHVRARTREDYEDLKYPYIENYQDALRQTLARSGKQSIILITGSLAFVGVVRDYLKEDKKR